MPFNSITFAVFFLIVYVTYRLSGRSYRTQNLLLLAASYVFYGWWDVRFLVVIVLSGVVAYCCALSIDKRRMTAKQRVRASGFLILAAVLFLGIRWDAVKFALPRWHPSITVDWNNFVFTDSQHYKLILGIAATIALFNISYIFLSRLRDNHRRKFFLIFSITANLAVLGVFKYYNFFVDTFRTLVHSIAGISVNTETLNIVLPIGISFYTFQTMGYVIDVYRRKIQTTESLLDTAVFTAFFPLVLSGPIERGASLLPQFQNPRLIKASDLREGAWLIIWGLYKKMVIADNLAKIVNTTFAPFDNGVSALAVPQDGLRILAAIYAFAFQIYCDFSGYTDIARGAAQLLGFNIRLNFNLPYFARNPSDFWRRWHISLSSWLRDYLYIPLGGSRYGPYKTARNLMITFLLCGLWHGAAWTFVLWGIFQGILLTLHHTLTRNSEGATPRWWVSAIQCAFMFHVSCAGWLLFRAQNLNTVGVFSQSILLHPNLSTEATSCFGKLVFYCGFLVLFQAIQGLTGTLNPLSRLPWFIRLNIWLFVIMSVLSLAESHGGKFIYFAF
jgi:D-alanyl-lipoteichoic acid acyltransferase DltB (MBOAT superfamily)